MDEVWSLVLLFGIFAAFGVLLGGRSGGIWRPLSRMCERLIVFAFRSLVSILRPVFKGGIGAIKLPKPSLPKKDNGPPGPPPTRWKD